jgi:hypothetical protein
MVPAYMRHISSSTRFIKVPCATFLAVTAVVGSAVAQVTVPDVPYAERARRATPITAAEATRHANAAYSRIFADVSFRADKVPQDSLLRVVSDSALIWATRLSATPVRGIHLDAAGRLSTAARKDDVAKRQIAERLSTPGLSLEDKAFTYLNAVRTFSSPDYPQRHPDAEAYLKALDAMGKEAAVQQVQARTVLISTYFMLGRSDDIVRLGLRVVDLVAMIPFIDRDAVFDNLLFYGELAAALSGKPDARATIDAVNAKLRAATVLSPEDAAIDTAYAKLALRYKVRLEPQIEANALVGTQGKPLSAQYWLNRPTSDSATIAVDDGKIRIIEFGGYACPGCLSGLYGLQRIKQAVPDVEIAMMTATFGSWGNRNVTPAVECEQLKRHFLDYMKVTIPIGIWQSRFVENEDGGFAPQDHGPNFKHYPLLSKPTTWLVDGNGRIRRIFQGYNRDIETRMLHAVRFLMRETAATSASTSTLEATPPALVPTQAVVTQASVTR